MIEPYQAGLIGFLASVVVFYLVSVFWGGTPTNVKQFFHDKNVKWNVFSLTAVNLALAQGIVYVLDGTQTFGLLYLLLPAMLFLGQFVVYPKLVSLAGENLFARGTLLTGLADNLDEAASKPVHFQQLTTSYVIVTYVVCLAYEIFVSSNWLAVAMFPTPGIPGKMIISLMLLALTMSYTVTGGYRTVQRTDLMQVIFGMILIGGIIWFLLSNSQTSANATKSALFPSSTPVLIGFLTMVLTPFTAQIYGILNHSFASHQENAVERRSLFRAAGVMISVIYIVLAFVALYYNHNKGVAKAALESWLSSSMNAGLTANTLFVVLAAVGMGAAVMSTVDTLMITVTQNGYEGLFKGNSKLEDSNNHQLRNIRIAMLSILLPVFAILTWWWYSDVNSFSLIFAVASPCEALAPMVVCLVCLSKENNIGAILRPVFWKLRYLDLFYVLLFFTLAGAFIALGFHWKWSRGVGFFAFVISSFLSLVVVRQSPNSQS